MLSFYGAATNYIYMERGKQVQTFKQKGCWIIPFLTPNYSNNLAGLILASSLYTQMF